MTHRGLRLLAIILLALLTAACPKGRSDFKKGQQAELQKDYDTALIHYQRALKAEPGNTLYDLRSMRMRFEAAQMHVDRGHKLRDQGLLEPAVAEFEKALAIDPSSFVAEQELRNTLELIVAQRRADVRAAKQQRPGSFGSRLEQVPSGPPQLKPLSQAPLNLRMNEDAKKIYETIGKLAGINVIFDPDFQTRRVPVELSNATVEQALGIVALITKTFWKAVTPNTIMVIPDSKAKRQMYEEQVIKTFYLSNLTQATELNELVQTLRTLLELTRITPSTSQNAIIIRDTPDKVAVAEKIIQDIDRAKPEVVIQVTVLQARRDRARELGILPSTSVPLIFTPRSSLGPETGDDGTTGAIRLNSLGRLSSSDYSLILPSATAMALLTESTTKVLQNPQVRVTDGQTAKLRIGDRVPFAVGSFQPGIGGVGINPLVNTQFQFQDVGVNLDITPHVHPNREISLHVIVEVSSVAGRVNIGGVEQPIFGQRKLEHHIRLREGEVSILGGIVERTESVSLEGWPGLAKVPFLRYLFGSKRKESQESEILIVLTPRIVRMPEFSALNLRPLAIGTGQAITLRRQAAAPPSAPPPVVPRAPAARPEPEPPQTSPPEPGVAQLRFDPAQARVGIGQQVAVNLVIERVQDLFTVPFALSYNPQVVELVDVHHGGFLGGGEYPAALVHRVDVESGAAIISLSRPPGTSGVSGQGVLVTLVFRGLAPGQTVLSISRIAARTSNRERLEVETLSGAIVVEQNTGQMDPRAESNPRTESPTP